MKHCLVFASLISPSKMILFEKKYQTFDTVFHHQMKHLEVRQKYSAARRIFNSLLGVSSGDETLHLMFDILLEEFFPFPFPSGRHPAPLVPAALLPHPPLPFRPHPEAGRRGPLGHQAAGSPREDLNE